MSYGDGRPFGGGGGSGGPRWGWGDVPGGMTGRTRFGSGRIPGPRGGPEAGLRRGEWQRLGHGPGAWNDYAWEYRGGAEHDRPLRRTAAQVGPRDSGRRRMAEQRSGGLPRERHRYASDRWFSRLGEGRYDRGYRGGFAG